MCYPLSYIRSRSFLTVSRAPPRYPRSVFSTLCHPLLRVSQPHRDPTGLASRHHHTWSLSVPRNLVKRTRSWRYILSNVFLGGVVAVILMTERDLRMRSVAPRTKCKSMYDRNGSCLRNFGRLFPRFSMVIDS